MSAAAAITAAAAKAWIAADTDATRTNIGIITAIRGWRFQEHVYVNEEYDPEKQAEKQHTVVIMTEPGRREGSRAWIWPDQMGHRGR
jgi:hypothetical protein